MRAATIREKEIVIEEHPDPVALAGEVLVRVRAAGLNGADMMQRRGLYPAPPGSPQDIPGMELAGEVAALGAGAERFAVGERVMAIVGGVGTAAIQLGRAVGARVTATVRREELREQVAALGAEAIPPEGFAERGPFDVILELVGAPNLAENVLALATGGRLSIIGVAAGAKGELNLLALMGKRARIHGSTLRARPLEQKALVARRLEHEVLPLFDAGALRVPIAETFPLEQAEAAYERFAAGGKLGKIVLTM
jgi:NADPH:quinone reductase-like Zn-dependent oxidoreductase